jgi:hypothetical protein
VPPHLLITNTKGEREGNKTKQIVVFSLFFALVESSTAIVKGDRSAKVNLHLKHRCRICGMARMR